VRGFEVAAVLLCLAVLLGCSKASDVPKTPEMPETPETAGKQAVGGRRVVGVKIHETGRPLQPLFDELQDLGIDTVFADEKLASSGGFRALAERNGTGLFINFPVFFAPQELAEDPNLWAITSAGERAKEDWVEFACPSRIDFRKRRVQEARGIVRRLRPEGISIDFIRDFVFWEMVGPDRDPMTLPDTCYCVHCLQAFAVYLGVPAFSIPPQTARAAAWIRANAAQEWVRFKNETITSMAREIVEGARSVDRDILVVINLVPWRRDDFAGANLRVAAQDWSALSATADYLSPLAYSFTLHRPPEWIASVVQDVSWVADCPVLPSIQVGAAYREGEIFSNREFEACLRAALEPPSAGVVLRSWDHIEADPDKAAVIRRVVGGESLESSTSER
jgi:hypothetical protein